MSEKLKRKLGVLDLPVVISIRNLKPIYDVESLINAAPLVLKEIPEARFVILGRGSQEAYLKKLASSLGISTNVSFVGLVSHDELPQYLASSDVYVSTSLSDGGLAASTSEAMACGLPVVITDFGDNGKWVEDGVSGFLVPLRDPETLAARIVYLLQTKDDRIKFGQANRQIIEERNSYEREIAKVGKLYEELIERYKK
jgi:glycosyltransferase involved in cell wall biosynthesis